MKNKSTSLSQYKLINHKPYISLISYFPICKTKFIIGVRLCKGEVHFHSIH